MGIFYQIIAILFLITQEFHYLQKFISLNEPVMFHRGKWKLARAEQVFNSKSFLTFI